MHPLAAIALGTGVRRLVLWRASGRCALGVLGGLWLFYAGWEVLMAARIGCSGECNIRVDLLLIAPPLLLCTLGFLATTAWRAIRRRRPRVG